MNLHLFSTKQGVSTLLAGIAFSFTAVATNPTPAETEPPTVEAVEEQPLPEEAAPQEATPTEQEEKEQEKECALVAVGQVMSLEAVDEKLQAMGEPKKGNEGPIAAMRMAIGFLNSMSTLYPNAYVSIIKETDNHGNTSVAMGTAAVYFKAHEDENLVLVINYGTGGPKFQLYEKSLQSGQIKLRKEIKLPEKKGAQKTITLVGNVKRSNLYLAKGKTPHTYFGAGKPETEVALDITKTDKHRNYAKDSLKDFTKKVAAELQTALEGKAVMCIPLFTGDIRKNYYREIAKGKQAIKYQRALEDVVDVMCRELGKKLVKGVEHIEDYHDEESYCLPQDAEGQLELIACHTMHLNLLSAGELPLGGMDADYFGSLRNKASLGIGRGSTQLAGYDGKEIFTSKVNVGMNKPDELLKNSALLLARFSNNIDSYIVDKNKPFVLFLKSGALLAVSKKKDFEQFFGK